ncbi:MAG: pirin family protein [Nevskiaceae bacterium]|nr:MAG: pirin family protein [Nevskiaceae bacterium]TAM28368.1 MAG: pirin family protein [Nevskiaceae bacterium]
MDAILDLIPGRPRDLGGFAVRRVLPIGHRKTVGPFIFFDHLGPAVLKAGSGMDVRPHPHIGLATVTYLFEGRIRHRDSLGSVQDVEPLAVNWMTAGSGIVHSERSTDQDRRIDRPIHGIQSWVALPSADEECRPSFVHHPADSLPQVRRDGVALRVIAGSAYGLSSPVELRAPTFYVHAEMAAGSSLPVPDEYEERAVYPINGRVRIGERWIEEGQMAVLKPGTTVSLRADAAARVMLLGGAPVDAPRQVWWNFVSSRPERIEQARRDWAERRFAEVPGETEFIPLPAV